MTDQTATLAIEGSDFSYPLLEGSVGPDVVDIRKMYGETGKFTYDPGFTSTASCQSAITYIDGDEGILLHRGYPIDQLAEQSSFMEVAYLLLHGDLPSKRKLEDFNYTITRHTMVHEQIATFYRGFRRDAHPMAIMCGVVGALSSFYHDSTDITDPQQRMIASHRLIAKMPTLGAWAFRHAQGKPYVYPDNELSYTANFLSMLFKMSEQKYNGDERLVKALDVLFILHADHEQNCSTTATRLVGSSEVDPYSAVAAGIAALYGPLHGGANEAVLRMLREIGHVSKVPAFIKDVKEGQGEKRLMGFGHRVYKSYDPRAKVIKRVADEVFAVTGRNPLLDIALKLEEVALADEYFISRKLYPNVDFYSGLIYQAMDFPIEMFTVLFAIPRTAGWLAHWRELVIQDQKIARPRQLYTGPVERDYVGIESR